MTDASEARYRRLFEGMLDGYVRTDLNGKIQEFNAAYLKMHGYSKEELLSMTYMDLTPEKWRSMEAEIMEKQTLANGYSKLYEKEYRKKDGTLVPIELRAYLERDEDNKPIGYWAIVRDISNRKSSEKALKNSELKYRRLSEQSFQGIVLMQETGIVFVNQAFADITGISIEEALDMDMGDIWKMIHPDDRNLLVQGFLDMLGDQKMPPRAEFRIVRKDGGVRLVEGYAIATDFDGEATVQAVMLDITEMRKAEEEMRKSEQKYHMLFDTSMDEVRADQYLDDLLMNLLDNAIIHNNKNPKKVWVTLREAKGGYEISIADNGPGISDEKKESLFDRERRFGGVGIHQALRIAQKYGGYLSVDDRVANDSSQGAKFRLWLPRSDASTS